MQDYFLLEEGKFLINYKKTFPIKNPHKIPTLELAPEPAPEPANDPKVFNTPKPTKPKTRHKISPLNLREEFVNEIVNHGKKVNNEIFKDCFGFQNPSLL